MGEFSLSEQIPDATSLITMGLSLQQTIQTRPSVVLSPQVLTGSDSRGVMQTGVAFQWKLPLWLRRGASPSSHENSYAQRLLDSLEVSAAATKAASNGDEALQLGLGLSVTPWDRGDPWLDPDLKNCLQSSDPRTTTLREDELAHVRGNFQDEDLGEISQAMATLAYQRDGLRTQYAPEAVITLIEREMDDKVASYSARCRERAHFKLWNASRWSLGIVPKWIGRNGDAGDLQWNTATMWTTFAYGFEAFEGTPLSFMSDDLQFLTGFHYRPNELVSVLTASDGDGLRERDTLIISSQLRWGVRRPGSEQAAKLILGLEALYEHENRKGRSNRDSQRLSMSVDYSIFRMASLNLTFGGTTKGGGEANGAFIMSTLKFGF